MTAPFPRWMTPRQVAEYTGRHYKTIVAAMRSGELRAGQRVKAGSWRADIVDVDAWVRGEKPPPRVVTLAGRRRA